MYVAYKRLKVFQETVHLKNIWFVSYIWKESLNNKLVCVFSKKQFDSQEGWELFLHIELGEESEGYLKNLPLQLSRDS